MMNYLLNFSFELILILKPFLIIILQGLSVEIVRVLPDSPPPGLSNIFCNADEANPADMVSL